MNFLYRLREDYARFMYGRYGGDTLNRFLSGVYLALVVVGFILSAINRLHPTAALSVVRMVLYYLSLALFLWTIFRMLSKKISKRQKENARFMRWWGNWQPYFREKAKKNEPKVRLFVNKMQDSEHLYKKCPQCKAVLRLAKKRGKHTTRCPACGHKFNVRIVFGDK